MNTKPQNDPKPAAARKPYEPPAVAEENVFERNALMAACSNPGQCGAPFKAPS